MEINLPPNLRNLFSPRDRIVQRLVLCGVRKEQLDQLPLGLVVFMKENKSRLPELVSTILSIDPNSTAGSEDSSIKDECIESLALLQWLMFEGEPVNSLKNLAEISVGQHGVCGAVWEQDDLAYHCRTCEHDPTCAICVPCFQNGDHTGHDYCLMYTGGGCCDCGDATAWKREGFCSKHKGAEQIRPLPEEIAGSMGPVLDVLLVCWKEKLIVAETNGVSSSVANKFSSAVIEMLLDFCKYSESLLSFVSKRMFSSVGLLDVLVRAERFLDNVVMRKLQGLLLKFLAEPTFKYEFAKVFVNFYPIIVKEAIKEGGDKVFEKYLLPSSFSVQIFTVPTLTPRLVREVHLLDQLLGCLEDLFLSCVGENGYLELSRWANLYDTTIRLVEDIRFVMSHTEVYKYVAHERTDLSRTWMRLLSLVQGMDPQKRATELHVEEENENTTMPFGLGHYLGNIYPLLVEGAFSVVDAEATNVNTILYTDILDLDDSERLRQAKVGRLSQESSVCSMTGRSSALDRALQVTEVKNDIGSCLSVPSSVTWLIFECLKAIDNWLRLNSAPKNLLTTTSPDASIITGYNTLRKKLFKTRKGRNVTRICRTASTSAADATGERPTTSAELRGRFDSSSPVYGGLGDMDPEYACLTGSFDDSMEADCAIELEALAVLNLKDWPAIIYDVSSQDISFHIPLHRLLSLLLHKALRRCYGESGMLEMGDAFSTLPLPGHIHDFFGQVLGGCHPYGLSACMMEHPLRLRVFCAEVRAGMWRKNGDAAILSCELYRSARWSEQCLEVDLFLLQCCAALAPPDLYVKRIQERFGLSDYFSLNIELGNEYEPILVQEMLTLIIQIVKERRFCGLHTAEILQRELVCRLATGDATHSQLVKSLPTDLSKSGHLQKVLDTLAVYANPSRMKQGRYSLCKAYWKELDLYHPRWNSRDLQVAEERYLRFCKVSALTVQLPHWTKVINPLSTISRIATCKAVLQIIRTVLVYAVFMGNSSVSRAPDGVLVTALHLLSLALDICYVQKQVCAAKVGNNVDLSRFSDQSYMSSPCHDDDLFPVLVYASENIDVGAASGPDTWKHQSMLSLLVSLMRKYKKENEQNFIEASQCDISSLILSLLKKFAELNTVCMTELQRFAPDVFCHSSLHTPDSGQQISGSASDGKERKAKVRERQAAILAKMKAEQSRFMKSLISTANDGVGFTKSKQDASISDVFHVTEESAPIICSLCRDPDSRSPISRLVLLQRSRLPSFVERGLPSWEGIHELDKEYVPITTKKMTDPSGSNTLLSSSETTSSHLVLNGSSITTTHISSPLEKMEDDIYQSIQRDIHDIILHSVMHAEENLTESRNAESAVLREYVASLSRETSKHSPSSESASPKPIVQFTAFDGFGPADCDGIHVSSCGHAVHQECHDRYMSSLKQRYARRISFEGGHILDPDLGEFLCPVCRRLANSILPTFPGDYSEVGNQKMLPEPVSTSIPGSSISSDSVKNVLFVSQSISLLRSAANMVGKSSFLKAFPVQRNESVIPALKPIFHILCRMYFPDRYGSFSASGRVSHSLILWDTLRFSLISTEIAARGGKFNMIAGGSSTGLEALYKEAESSTGFIFSLLLQVVQTTRSQNRLQVLLRFRGIQLFAGSICSGVSLDVFSTSRSNRRGNISSILDNVDKEVAFPDIKFWKRAADPVLAHDPFSSLMWVLFSLPHPCLSSTESFASLVHLFYVVCVIQALITCRGMHLHDAFESSSSNCLIDNIFKIMGESVVSQQYFVSNYIDSSCHPKDMIRRLTLPYLRRCALLWKLLKLSTSSPICNSSHGWDGASPHTTNDMPENINSLSIELKELRELEQMFQIISLEAILKDEAVHTLALKWCLHFCKEFEVQNYGRILPTTPAVPFKLMHLPKVYQDLLQRYIKQPCPDCKSLPEESALCLLCGRLCSPSWKSCCRENGCQSHAIVCGAGVGVFLLIRRTTILLQRFARQAPWPSPYLDAFGEEDINMHRGKPLYLNEERYAALTYMVASHGIDQNSEVLRQTTINQI